MVSDGQKSNTAVKISAVFGPDISGLTSSGGVPTAGRIFDIRASAGVWGCPWRWSDLLAAVTPASSLQDFMPTPGAAAAHRHPMLEPALRIVALGSAGHAGGRATWNKGQSQDARAKRPAGTLCRRTARRGSLVSAASGWADSLGLNRRKNLTCDHNVSP